jgi:Zn-dependent protease with chaperone function
MRLVVYLVVFAVIFALAVSVVFSALAGSTFLLFDEEGRPSSIQAVGRFVFSRGALLPLVFGFVLAVIYEVWALARDERWLLRRMEASISPKGADIPTKLVLKDMAIAAGMPIAPALHVLPTRNVNAFAYRAPGRRAVVGVTQGSLTRLTIDEQRAVFANLVARLATGDMMVSSAVASLLAPLNWWRAERLKTSDEENARLATGRAEKRDPNAQAMGGLGLAGSLSVLVAFPVVLAGELLAAFQRRSHLVASEKADAEGMLLLKDPVAMLSALEKAVRLNNNIVAADESLGDLFYCWTGDSTDDESDPEWHRVARMREVLGVDGWVPDDPDAIS